MAQDAAPTPAGGVYTETSHHGTGHLVITHQVMPDPESIDPAATIAKLTIDVKTAAQPDGIPAEVGIETDRDGTEVVLLLDYSAVDVLHGKVTDLLRDLRAEVTA